MFRKANHAQLIKFYQIYQQETYYEKKVLIQVKKFCRQVLWMKTFVVYFYLGEGHTRSYVF